MKQLQGVLNSISEDLDNASTNLTPVASDAAPQASNESVGSVAERVSWAIVVGSAVGAILLALLLIRVARSRRRGPGDDDLDPAPRTPAWSQLRQAPPADPADRRVRDLFRWPATLGARATVHTVPDNS